MELPTIYHFLFFFPIHIFIRLDLTSTVFLYPHITAFSGLLFFICFLVFLHLDLCDLEKKISSTSLAGSKKWHPDSSLFFTLTLFFLFFFILVFFFFCSPCFVSRVMYIAC